MTYSDTIRIISGLLQLGVAWYALRLSRLSKSGRAGWLLFSALSLLALAYVLLPINPFRSSIHLAVRADVVMGLISTLLIAAMVHLDLRFRKQFESQAADRQSHTAWEARVGDQLEELNKTNDELRQTAASLQTQLGDSIRDQQQNEQMSREILSTSRQTETELRQTITELETQIERLKEAQEAAATTHQAQLAEARDTAHAEAFVAFARDLLPQASETSSSLASARRASADLVRSRFSPLVRAAKALNECIRELALLHKRNPRGTQVQQRLQQIAQQLAGEQSQLVKKIAAIDQVLAALESSAHQRFEELSAKAGLPAEESQTAPVESDTGSISPALTTESAPQLIGDVTQTGTELVAPEPAPDASDPAASDTDVAPLRDLSAESSPAYLGGSDA